MQVLQAGQHKLIYMELQPEMVSTIARQAGFEVRARDAARTISLDLAAPGRQTPLLLFDASHPANLGWFSRCQCCVDGRSGAVMQTPLSVANKRDRSGRLHTNAVRLGIAKELPVLVGQILEVGGCFNGGENHATILLSAPRNGLAATVSPVRSQE